MFFSGISNNYFAKGFVNTAALPNSATISDNAVAIRSQMDRSVATSAKPSQIAGKTHVFSIIAHFQARLQTYF
jgi:hypothetical protein